MIAILLLIVLPILELWAAVVVASWIGVLATLALLVALLSLLGVVLIRIEGLAAWRRTNAEIAAGRAPTNAMVDGLMVVAGGLLLIVPGFLTAVPGLLLLFPPTRALLRPLLDRWIEKRAVSTATFGPTILLGGSFGPTAGSPRASTPFGARRRWGSVIDAEAHDAGVADHAEVVDLRVEGPGELDRPR